MGFGELDGCMLGYGIKWHLSTTVRYVLHTHVSWPIHHVHNRSTSNFSLCFIGQLLLNSPYLGVSDHFTISRISPIAVSPSKTITFRVNGFGSSLSSARFFTRFISLFFCLHY